MIWWIEQTFVVTAAMAAVVWGICRWKRVPAQLRHLLWLAVIVKLLLPPVVAWPWAVGGAGRDSAVAVSAEDGRGTMMMRLQHWLALEDEPAGQQVAGGAAGANSAGEEPGAPASPHDAAMPTVAPAAARSRPAEAPKAGAWQMTPGLLRRWLLAGGIAGMAGVALLQLARIVRMARVVRAAAPASAAPASAALERELRQLAERMRMRAIPARVVAGLDGPYVWSLARPVLLWPVELPVDGAARGLIVHELAHVKRRDHWIGWLELAAGIVWWWNPVYYAARRQLRANAELCCDAAVVDRFPGERRSYADSLLAVCEGRTSRRVPPLALGVKSAKRELSDRLAAVMSAGSRRRPPLAAWIAMLLLAALALPAFAQSASAGSKLPFTISKETTVITGPLNADGTPDYIGALNDMMKKGVTPENNGFTLFSELSATNELGGDSFPPKVREQILKLAGAKTLPAGSPTWQNWESYVSAITGDKYPGSSKLSGAIVWEMWQGQRELWTERDHPELSQYLKNQQVLLDKADEAAMREKWWMPMVSANGRALSGAQPMSDGAGDVANALAARSLQRLKAGDFDGFLRDVSVIKQMSRHLDSEPTLYRLRGSTIDQIANSALVPAVASGMLNEAQCAALAKSLDRLPPLRDFGESVNVGIRWDDLDVVILVATGHVAIFGPDDVGHGVGFETIDRDAVDWDIVLRHVNRVIDDEIAAMKLSDMAEMKKQVAAVIAKEQTWKSASPSPFSISFRKTAAHASRQDYSEWVAQGMMVMMVGANGDMEERERQARMADQMVRVLLAAADARARTGQWPATVEGILPQVLKEMPRDVYSNDGAAPVKYVLASEGPVVYSVGPNGKDDGGVLERARKMDDIALPVRPIPTTAPSVP